VFFPRRRVVRSHSNPNAVSQRINDCCQLPSAVLWRHSVLHLRPLSCQSSRMANIQSVPLQARIVTPHACRCCSE
jgi:hypothetical protein